MKKFIALVLALGLAVSAVGCAKDTKPPASTADPDDNASVSFKSYTVSDEAAAAARNEVVATVGDKSLTNGVLQVYYWMGIYTFMSSEYGGYADYYGLDYTQPLDQQGPFEADQSWQEYFLEDAVTTWHVYQVLSTALAAEGLSLSTEYEEVLSNRLAQLEKSAKDQGFDSVDQLIQSDAGAGCTVEDYMAYTRTYYEYKYYVEQLVDRIEVSQEDIEAYYKEYKESLNESGITKDSGNVFHVRHILIQPEGGTEDDGVTTYSDAEWEACQNEAQQLLDQWLAGEATEDTFAQLAKEHSDDPGSDSEGGLYEGLDKDTDFMETFKNWYLEEGRQVGDYGLIKTDYGYHLMYLSGIETQWIYYCRNGFINDTATDAIEKLKSDNPYTADFDKMVLAEVKLVEES